MEVEKGDATAEAEEVGTSTMEGTDASLTGTVVEATVDRDRGGWLTVDDGDQRRGGKVNVGDGLKRLMGEGQVAGRFSVVEGDLRLTLVGSGTTQKSAGGGRGRSRVAGDGIGGRPCSLGGPGGIGTGIGARLWADGRADVAG